MCIQRLTSLIADQKFERVILEYHAILYNRLLDQFQSPLIQDYLWREEQRVDR